MTKKTLKAVRKKHSSWQKYQQTKEHIHFQHYCRDRNTSTRECRKYRSDFETKISGKQHIKYFFKYVNSGRKVNMGISTLTDSDGNMVEIDLGKANELNTFYSVLFQ